MNNRDDLIDPGVVKQLVKDIGPDKSRDFLKFLEEEFDLRQASIEEAFKELDIDMLAKEAHAFKGCAVTYGARPLAALLQEIEDLARQRQNRALELVGNLLKLSEQTRQAFRHYALDK